VRGTTRKKKPEEVGPPHLATQSQSLTIAPLFPATMKHLLSASALLLLILPLPSEAAQKTYGFRYNDDVQCGYPFAEFVVDSISCDKTSATHIMLEGVNDYDSTNEDGSICHYGDHMEVEGEVTTVEPISRYFDVYALVCFKSNVASSGYYSSNNSSGKKCHKFHSVLDLSSYEPPKQNYNYDEADAEAEANNDYSQNRYYAEDQFDDQFEYRSQSNEFLPVGTYKWSAYLSVPPQSFAFKSSKSLSRIRRVFPLRKHTLSHLCTISFTFQLVPCRPPFHSIRNRSIWAPNTMGAPNICTMAWLGIHT